MSASRLRRPRAASTSHAPQHRRRAALSAAALTALAVPLLASCATGFGSPLRNADANLQAATANVGPIQVRGLIVALPDGSSADKGGVAYIEFTAVNVSSQADTLQHATATFDAPATAAAATAASTPVEVSAQQLPIGSTAIPAKTDAAPGTARIVVALDPLSVALSQGDSVRVSLTFKNSGGVESLPVPVLGADRVGPSFLPSASPTLPSSEAPSEPPASVPAGPPTSAPASPPASAA